MIDQLDDDLSSRVQQEGIDGARGRDLLGESLGKQRCRGARLEHAALHRARTEVMREEPHDQRDVRPEQQNKESHGATKQPSHCPFRGRAS
ncbi:MAG: hypothetical protein HC882_07840 [Acidobacteria bacterium]|nr:hypothetical protein [Acidobacteriota bacterium]